MTSLLVTGAGGPAGRALGEQLTSRTTAGADLTWVGVDIVPVADTNFPVTDLAPRADGWQYATGMRDLIDKYAPDLVLPTVQDELPQIAVLAQALDHQVLVAAPGPTALAADKLLTMLSLDRNRVPVPRYALATDFASAQAALDWARGPAVIKPRVSRGGRGVRLLETPTDPTGTAHWTDLDASWIVQSFAPGTEYSPQVYRTPTGHCTTVVLEKTLLKQGRVGNAAAVVRLAPGAAPDIEQTARRAIEALDLVGPVDLDIRRDPTGAPVVLEINSRFGANSTHAPELLDQALAHRPQT